MACRDQEIDSHGLEQWNRGPGCPLATSLTSPPACLNREHSPIPTHLKQVLFQGNQGAGPERSCSPASSTGTGPGFRTLVEEEPVASPRGQRTGVEIKVGEPPAWGPFRQLSPPWRRTEQAARRGMDWPLAPAHAEITFFSKIGGRKLLSTPHPRLAQSLCTWIPGGLPRGSPGIP